MLNQCFVNENVWKEGTSAKPELNWSGVEGLKCWRSRGLSHLGLAWEAPVDPTRNQLVVSRTICAIVALDGTSYLTHL